MLPSAVAPRLRRKLVQARLIEGIAPARESNRKAMSDFFMVGVFCVFDFAKIQRKMKFEY